MIKEPGQKIPNFNGLLLKIAILYLLKLCQWQPKKIVSTVGDGVKIF